MISNVEWARIQSVITSPRTSRSRALVAEKTFTPRSPTAISTLLHSRRRRGCFSGDSSLIHPLQPSRQDKLSGQLLVERMGRRSTVCGRDHRAVTVSHEVARRINPHYGCLV